MRLLILRFTFMLCMLSLAPRLRAATVIPDSPLSAPAKAVLRVDDAGGLSVWWPEEAVYRMSESPDGGGSWSPAPLLTVLPDATVAFDREGRAYYAYWGYDPEEAMKLLTVAVSWDNGLSFADTSAVVERRWACCFEYGPPVLRTGEAGRAWAGSWWSDSDGDYWESYVVCQTDDGGTSWSSPLELAEYGWTEMSLAVTPWNSLASAHIYHNPWSHCPGDPEPADVVHDSAHNILGESYPCAGSLSTLRLGGTPDGQLVTSWNHGLGFPGGSIRTLQVSDGHGPVISSPLAIQPVFDSARHAYATEIRDGRLLLHRSADLAESYDVVHELTDGDGRVIEAVEILPDGSGRVFALWVEDNRGLGEINVSVSPDFGRSWMPNPYRMDDVGKMPSDSQLLDAQLEGDHLIVVWHEEGRGLLVERFDPLVASLSAESGTPGESMTMSLELEDVTGRDVQSIQAVLSFDAVKLTLENVRLGPLANSAGWTWNHAVAESLLAVTMSGPQPLAGAGVIVELDWVVSATAPDGDTQQTWNYFKLNEGLPLTVPIDGMITVRRPAMSVMSVEPEPLSWVLNAPLNVDAIFDAELDPSQPLEGLAHVLSDVRGRVDTAWSVTDRGKLRGVTQGQPIAGERLSASIAGNLRSVAGEVLPQPHVWDSFAGSAVGELAFLPSLVHSAPGLCGVAVGDWDGDEDVDGALIRGGDDHDLIVLRRQCCGFSAQPPLPLMEDPTLVLATDLDGDGDVDIITAHGTGQAIAVLRNDGSGIFGPIEALALGATPYRIAVGDLNGDGVPELVSANATEGYLTILDNEDGVLAPRPPFAQGSGARDVALGDMNGDGALDIAASCPGWSRHSVFLNDGHGNFVEFGPGVIDYRPHALELVDLDQDGDLDMATLGDQTNMYLGLKLNDGDGGLEEGILYQNMGQGLDDIYAADLDGDRMPDLVVGNAVEGELTVLTQIDTGGIGAIRVIDAPGATDDDRGNLRLMDLNGDGALDIFSSYRASGRAYAWYQLEIVTATEPHSLHPMETRFRGARPNPFNPSTELWFSLSVGGDARLQILDAAGRRVREFHLAHMSPGTHSVKWDGRDHRGSNVASGVYFIQLLANGGEYTGRVALVR